jgi:hypothetical protein
MQYLFNDAKKATVCILGVALLWTMLFRLNTLLFSYFEKNQFVNLFFMPAGVRLIAVLLFAELGVAGLLLGALITSSSINITIMMATCLISAINPYLAIHLTKRFFQVDFLLNNLNAKVLILMGVFSAGFNALTHHLYFYYAELTTSWLNCLTMFVGDLLGIAIMMLLFSLILKLIRKSTSLSI